MQLDKLNQPLGTFCSKMKFQIQRVPVTFTVTMSKMLLVISQVIRSWQNSRHLLMEPLLPDIPKDKFTTSWLKQILLYQSPYFQKDIMSPEERVLEQFWSVIKHVHHSPPTQLLARSAHWKKSYLVTYNILLPDQPS